MTQKTKNILLVFGLCITVILAYKFAVYKTIQLRSEQKVLKKEIAATNNIPLKLASLKSKERIYDSLLIEYQLSGGSVQNNLLNLLKTFSVENSLKLIEFEKPHTAYQNDLIVNTYRFKLEGNYNDITALIYQIEQHTKFGEIINLNFKKEKNYKTGKYYLQASVLLKSFG